jgi:hypothetical protein
MLTERRAELLALEYRIGKRIRRICLLFCAVVVVSNLITDCRERRPCPGARYLALATVNDWVTNERADEMIG